MPARPRPVGFLLQPRAVRLLALTVATGLGLAVAGCGRSSSPDTPAGPARSASASTTASASGRTGAGKGPGDFGDLKAICGPGTPSGASGRGITDKEIRIGVLADPGNTAAPGLEQEFFDVADAFSKWCNAAGGINGRRIVVDKWDAKLFNVGQAMLNACQKDFFLVGGGNALDQPGVKPRLACKLPVIPGYSVSEEASTAALQVKAFPQFVTQYGYGPLRLLTDAYPQAKEGMGVGSGNLASLVPLGKRVAEALEKNGVKVTAVQEKPPIVTNYRPYVEQLKNLKTQALYEFLGQSVAPEIQAMKDVGWNPLFLYFTSQFYTPQTVAAAKSLGAFPPTYVGLAHLPFELADRYPVLQQIKEQLQAAVSKPLYTEYTAEAYSAWALFAQSATGCGPALTTGCVLQKAGAHTDWTGGGLTPPVSTSPSNAKVSDCWLVVKLTGDGFVYDEKVTRPNNGVYNCDPKNTVTVKSYT